MLSVELGARIVVHTPKMELGRDAAETQPLTISPPPPPPPPSPSGNDRLRWQVLS